ncbi:hypothetical protein [Solimonas variicoloris]|uniref:hypothetical protein n=1 Tax=Solimonas variicoloris TaxID=254408 RepID=UPI0012B5435C|nr:hypothetical protein [Solimonas variicoloris]
MALSAGAVAAPPAAQNHRVQCWTDERGQRACGDSVPPQYVGQERQVFDGQGRVREVKPREKTDAEYAAEAQAAREREEAARRAQKQRDYDRFLLGTYNSEKDIERARDERIAMLDGRQRLAARTIADNEKAVAQQQARIDGLLKAGKTPGSALTQKLEDLKRTLDANRQAHAEFDAEKREVAEKYGDDLARYRALRAQQVAPKPSP